MKTKLSFPSWWLKRTCLAWILWPFSLFFLLISLFRRNCYRWGWCSIYRSTLPIIIVGNITVGGSGKTPVVIAIVEYLKQQGLRPAIISRGYKSHAATYPFWVSPVATAHEVGDEPLLMAQRCNCPVVIDANRKRAVQALEQSGLCNIIVSDDGLQHYALDRNVEIVVIDGERRFGNDFLLPAGMLREPISRLKTVDFIICNGGKAQYEEWNMQIKCNVLYALSDPHKQVNFHDFQHTKVHAIAGIGNPSRFFNFLRHSGLDIIEHAFPDHHVYTQDDFDFTQDNLPVLLTEKDAVKCKDFIYNNAWCVAIDAIIPKSFYVKLKESLTTCHG